MNKDSEIGITLVAGGATAPEGFVARGVACGVKRTGAKDVGVLSSEVGGGTAAAVYTTNALEAAPLAVTREVMGGSRVRAVVVNSGNSNEATGKRGLADAYRMQALAAEGLGLKPEEVAVASTGVIGEYLPMESVEAGIREATAAGLGREDNGFAESILTTDTRTKEAAVRVEVDGRVVTVGGTAKGSGMIHPNMATMLAFLTTDAAVEASCLQHTLSEATERTFNRVTVDGDTSPGDMVVFLANGAAGNEMVTSDHPDYPAFAGAVEAVARHLAKEIARDGEGATKLVEVAVEGAESEESAAALAKSIVGSNLVKAAVFGEDANWGRVVTAMGYSGARFDFAGLELFFGPVKVFSGGVRAEHDAAEANAALAGDEVRISARLSDGDASAVAYGCDLTYGYVEINGSYRT